MSEPAPPLTALRAFEAAARHMSFSAAAEELGVTPAALSFQIKALERRLGAPLFLRLNRAVALTDAGRALQPGVTSGFEQIREAWRAARRLQESNRLVVTAGPGFTAKWLAPRLGAFARAHPDVELRVSATLARLDFARDGLDVAIRFGLGADDGVFSEALMEDWTTPFMRPDIAARLDAPADLLGETLIHDESLNFLKRPPSWAEWLRAAGVGHGALKGPRFSQADHAVDAALEGAGVVLGRSSVAQSGLRSGALVAPFPLALGTPARYRVLCPLGQETRPTIARFRAWLHSEAAEEAVFREGRAITLIE